MANNQLKGFEDGFLDLVEEQLKRCRQELSDLDQNIVRLQEQRADAAKRVAQLEDLLRGNRHPEQGEDAEPSLVPTSKPRGPIADADAVVALIREHGEPMHYLEVHRNLVDRGYQIGGKGKPDTLLSRYFQDPRLNRVARGTYDIVDRHPEPAKSIAWTDKGETMQLAAEDNQDGSLYSRPRQSTSDSDESDEAEPDAKPSPPFSRLAQFKLPSPPVRRLNSRMTVAEMAAATLRQAGEPLHYREITKRILQTDAWKTRGKTPQDTVNSRMVVDIQDNAERSTFVRTGRGIYGLREWEE